jgi:hypothetical protein
MPVSSAQTLQPMEKILVMEPMEPLTNALLLCWLIANVVP